jgi:predicted amidophosphoribosyltransferase
MPKSTDHAISTGAHPESADQSHPAARPRLPTAADRPASADYPSEVHRSALATRAKRTAHAALTALTDLVLPAPCAGCGSPDQALCVRCAGAFDGPFDVHRLLTATGPPIHALAAYRDTARTILLSFKERGRRDLAVPLGRMVAAVLPTLPTAQPAADGTWWLVPAPSRRSVARRRGGPHIHRLARATAVALAARGQPAAVAPALTLAPDTRDSADLDAAARIANLTGRVRCHPPGAPPPGTPVVLLDDVVTTGATAAACVRELTAAGLVPTAVVALTAT